MSNSNILIIGAGTWGCSIALELARRGHTDITVLDGSDFPSAISAGNDVNKIAEEGMLKPYQSQIREFESQDIIRSNGDTCSYPRRKIKAYSIQYLTYNIHNHLHIELTILNTSTIYSSHQLFTPLTTIAIN
jgi:thioredoxin reductase